MKLVRSKVTGGCYYSRMSDTEIPTSAPPASDAPAPEAIPTDVIAAPPVSAYTIPAVSIDEATAVAPPAPLSDSPADLPAEIPAPEHTDILENVGMFSNADNASAPTPSVQGNEPSPILPPTGPSALASGTAYAALLSLRDKALSAIQFRRQAPRAGESDKRGSDQKRT